MARKSAQNAPAAAPAPTDYTVLARRYRPGSFDELIGQDAVAQALRNAITSGRVAHAYLFTGARGVGKTSTARILAKALNCVDGPTLTPCNECESCRAVAVGEDVDVVEIDGASNRNLDDVRELRANVQFRPQRSRYKIYIIDEVHMLTRESFNALLKTLEEPPSHVKFIFATTEVNKVPVTILSRCQRFEFGGISASQIRSRLEEIVTAEKAKAEPEALAMLARRAGGSMRDAQSLLDQALAFTTGTLTVAGIHQLLGSANDQEVIDLAAAVLEKNQGRALGLVQQAMDAGAQPGELIDQMVELWRKFMLLKSAGKNSELAELSAEAREALARHVDLISLEQILAGLDLLVAAKGKLRLTSHARVVVESAVLRLCLLSELVPLSTLAADLAQRLSATPVSVQAQPPRRVGSPPPTAAQEITRHASEQKSAKTTAAPAGELSPPRLAEIWEQVLLQAGPMFSAALGKCTQKTLVPPATVVLGFPRTFQREREQAEKKLEKLADLFSKAAGQPTVVRTELLSAGAEVGAAPALSKEAVKKKTATRHPMVQGAMEQLGAQMLRVDDGFGDSGAEQERP